LHLETGSGLEPPLKAPARARVIVIAKVTAIASATAKAIANATAMANAIARATSFASTNRVEPSTSMGPLDRH